MSKYVNIKVETILTNDFYLEVDDSASKEEIEKLAIKEVKLPHMYPNIIDNFLKQRGINIQGIDSMLKDWNIKETKYIIND